MHVSDYVGSFFFASQVLSTTQKRQQQQQMKRLATVASESGILRAGTGLTRVESSCPMGEALKTDDKVAQQATLNLNDVPSEMGVLLFFEFFINFCMNKQFFFLSVVFLWHSFQWNLVPKNSRQR